MLTKYFPCILLLITLSLVLLSGCVTNPGAPVEPTLIGTISRVNDVVEQGQSPSQLAQVLEKNTLTSGDVLRVSSGGEGLIDFGGFLQLRMFNDTELRATKLERGENLPLFARIQLETGGFTGQLVDEGGQAIFETPNRAKITILGTQFWIIYDPSEQILGVGNFEGTTLVEIRDISMSISPNHYAIFRPGQPLGMENTMPMARVELEEEFRQRGSPVNVLWEVFLKGTATPTPALSDTPTPTSSASPEPSTPTPTLTFTPTYTPSPTSTPTPACPPTLEVIQNAFCREGPGTIWEYDTAFRVGTLLQARAISPFEPLWWYVYIPDSQASCWISDSTVRVIGDASCLPFGSVPPTYTPAPTQTNTPTPTYYYTTTASIHLDLLSPAPELLSLQNDADLECSPDESQDTLTLNWSPVSDASGIAYYQWCLENLDTGSVMSGFVPGISVGVQIDCGYQYRWRVRAVDTGYNVGLYSDH